MEIVFVFGVIKFSHLTTMHPQVRRKRLIWPIPGKKTTEIDAITNVRSSLPSVSLAGSLTDVPERKHNLTCRFFTLSNWSYLLALKCHIKFITARKRCLGQGNIFSSVCQEFCSQGESAWAGTLQGRNTPLGRYTPWAGTPPRQVHPPGSSACWEIRATSGRYASYWNAFLFIYLNWDDFCEAPFFDFLKNSDLY